MFLPDNKTDEIASYLRGFPEGEDDRMLPILTQLTVEDLGVDQPVALLLEDLAVAMEMTKAERASECIVFTRAMARGVAVARAAQVILNAMEYLMSEDQLGQWNRVAAKRNKNDPWEFSSLHVDGGRVVHAYTLHRTFRDRLRCISTLWWQRARVNGDGGACVLGAGFSFTPPKSEDYRPPWHQFLPAQSPWQGSLSWERPKEEVENWLRKAGATYINFVWGRMD